MRTFVIQAIEKLPDGGQRTCELELHINDNTTWVDSTAILNEGVITGVPTSDSGKE